LLDKVANAEQMQEWADQYFKVVRPVFLLQNKVEETFRDFYSRFGEKGPDLIKNALAPIRAPGVLQFQRFSDGLVVFFSLRGDIAKMGPFGARVLLLAAASAQLMTMLEGYLIRGGMEVDDGIELKQGELYGRALLGAYELEKNIAGYPRIVLGAGFMRLLQSYIESSGNPDPLLRVSAEMAKHCSGLVFKDNDGCAVVDFLSEELAAMFGEKRGEVFVKMKEFIQDQMKKHRADGKIYPRLKTLCDYMDSRSVVWMKGGDGKGPEGTN